MSKEIIEAKKVIVDEIAQQLKGAQSAIVVEYRGLSVADVTELRTALREENVGFKVYKNTLVQRAAEQEGMTELSDYLKGPNAIAFGREDAVAPARILAKFAKDHEALVIKAGYVEGKFLPQEEVMEVAKLPNREGMYSMLLAMMKEPVAKVARIIQAVADAKGGEEAAPVAE
ncbi:MAG: 50S ribosomal protein L10 [Erysipelotrichales bacterium]|nr:50S ribosomal protein L10 [Erysipelotrichales bacterium]